MEFVDIHPFGGLEELPLCLPVNAVQGDVQSGQANLHQLQRHTRREQNSIRIDVHRAAKLRSE